VLIHCDRAVRGDPENGGYRDSRGLARALAGMLQGAAEDFRAFLRWGPDNKRSEEQLAKRRQWLEALQSGSNPFDDPAALERLREEELPTGS
jgi:hypothetical protein